VGYHLAGDTVGRMARHQSYSPADNHQLVDRILEDWLRRIVMVGSPCLSLLPENLLEDIPEETSGFLDPESQYIVGQQQAIRVDKTVGLKVRVA